MSTYIAALANGKFTITDAQDGRPESGETIRPELTEEELCEEMIRRGVPETEREKLIADAKQHAPRS